MKKQNHRNETMNINKTKLWTRNFCLVTLASALGCAGAIAGGFALSFLVFDETGSTLASALIMAIQFVPYIFVPIIVAPIMDRLPRKIFLVCGDAANGILYAGLGLWLLFFDFSYIGYLAVSLVLACLGSVDQLAFTSFYPDLIPKGAEQKGYAVSSMLYPVLQVIMLPLAAVLLDYLGVAVLLIGQGCLSLAASVTESFIKTEKTDQNRSKHYSLKVWAGDIKEAVQYIRKEKGLLSIYSYMTVSNGVFSGVSPIMIAFFRTFPGFTAAMYSMFSVVEFIGRSIGSALQYRIRIPNKKKYGFIFFVYQFYDCMDMCLLWLPYPLMLVNRAICGFLGSNSAIMRSAAIQSYIPSNLRSRVNAFGDVLLTAGSTVFTLIFGVLGEMLDYRLCVTIGGVICIFASWFFIWGRRKSVRKVYEVEPQNQE